MKKGALATAGLALGAGATGTAAAQEDGTVLVYSDDYMPGVDFEVVSALNTSTKEDLLEASGSADDVFDDPDDWEAYVISYDLGVDAPTWGFLFTEDLSLSSGDSGTMGEDGEFRESPIGLVEVTPGATANGNGNGEEEDTEEENGGNGAGANGGGGGGGNTTDGGN
ncbi:calcium-binding protein [Natrinema ejinorense]|nr:calcium-binding protein [Natrinema ejinorense]